jgi:hypothetical protein
MPPNRQVLRAALTLSGAVALILATATSAAAAIIGTVAPAEAHPGDRVTLTVQGPAGQTQTVYLISTADFEKQIARLGRQVCNTAGQSSLGSFSWSGETGSLTFTVPKVPPGHYYVQVQVRNVSPDCWRIGGQSDALLLTVLGGASSEAGGSSFVSPLLVLLLIVGAAIGTAVIARLTRRPV